MFENWRNWNWRKWTLIAFGIELIIDGIGSIIVPNNHEILMDMGRVVRTGIGIVLVILGYKTQ